MLNLSRYFITLRKVISFALLFFIVAYGSGCQSKMQSSQWENANIDPTIAKNAAFEQLDIESEVFSFGENLDTSRKRTSGVAYFTEGHVNLTDSSSTRLNNCRAYFLKSDILNINIGIGSGFGGWGFIIHYKDRKFYTEPYYSTDVVIPDEPEPDFEVVYQKLTLDKPAYKLGDSLYGKIDFKAIETNQEGNKFNHSGKGYFRTIVREL